MRDVGRVSCCSCWLYFVPCAVVAAANLSSSFFLLLKAGVFIFSFLHTLASVIPRAHSTGPLWHGMLLTLGRGPWTVPSWGTWVCFLLCHGEWLALVWDSSTLVMRWVNYLVGYAKIKVPGVRDFFFNCNVNISGGKHACPWDTDEHQQVVALEGPLCLA